MTIKEAYKEGFAEELAAHGLTPSVVDQELSKVAGAETAGAKLMQALLTGAIAMPVIAGWGLGATKRTGKPDLKALTDMALLKDYQDGIRQLKSRDKEKTDNKLEKTPMMKASAPTAPAPAAQAQSATPVTDNIEKVKAQVAQPVQAKPAAQPATPAV